MTYGDDGVREAPPILPDEESWRQEYQVGRYDPNYGPLQTKGSAGTGGNMGAAALLGMLLGRGKTPDVSAGPSPIGMPSFSGQSTPPVPPVAGATGSPDRRKVHGGVSSALTGVLTGAGGTPQGGGTIQALLAQLLKRPRSQAPY